tara:strand:+ start:806 stop:1627 length:822 start_codon:yes stop_codon:yes gene_type:complete
MSYKVIFFTTCKPFIGDDAWRQEQAIKSWTLLTGVEIKIIIIGNDKGTKEICDKYNLIHEPNITTLQNVPYLHEMFVIANKYADSNDVMIWTNSDMIYFQHMIDIIKSFKSKYADLKNYALVGRRIDWFNPKILESFDYNKFANNINMHSKQSVIISHQSSNKYECAYHAECGIDYFIHSPTTVINNIDKNLVIAGTRHDMILVGMATSKNFYTCNVGFANHCIHQNHNNNQCHNAHVSSLYRDLINNNRKCKGVMKEITNCKYRIKDNLEFP